MVEGNMHHIYENWLSLSITIIYSDLIHNSAAANADVIIISVGATNTYWCH